jgi:hypothetical protein
MGFPTPPDQAKTAKTPEQIRTERIDAIGDPKVRQELVGIANARDAKLAQELEKQHQNFDKRVAELRDQKIRSANAPQPAPSGMQRAPYLGDAGQARAHSEATAQIKTLNQQYLQNVAKEYNVQIDNRLDAHRENQAGRAPLALKPAEPEHGPATLTPTRGPKRYAVIDQQNYAERAKQQANLNRENDQDPARQQQRHRGPQR